MLKILCMLAFASVPQNNLTKHLQKDIQYKQSYFKDKQKELLSFVREEKAPFRARWSAYSTLVQLNPSDKNLKLGLNANDWFLKDLGLKLATKYQPKLASKYAKKHLTDASLIVRTTAVKTIIELKENRYNEDLWLALNDKQNFRGKQSLWVRKHIVRALAEMYDSKDSSLWAKRFKQVLSDRDQSLHPYALYALSTIHPNGPKTNRAEPLTIQRQKWLSWLQ